MRRTTGRRVSLSLRNRLVLVFSAIVFAALAVLYLYVTPGLESRLLRDQEAGLAANARAHSGAIARTVGSSDPLSLVQNHVNAAALATGNRVTLLLVNEVAGGRELSALADSSRRSATAALSFAVARRAAASGRLETGTERTPAGIVGEAAYPVVFRGRVAAVVVYSAPSSNIARTVATVRHQILVAGAIALLLALLGSYLVARALAQRVKRLELAAEQVAAGNFSEPIPVDSRDELGQLAVAFNEMQRQLTQLESARKKFIATASHELRTPIFSLGGFVELLEDEDLDPDTRRRFLEQVRDQVERLRKLSVDLLDLSRLESGSLELRPEQVDLSELTRSVSGEFEPVLGQHDSHLELRVSSRRLEAICDPVRVAQIVRILIDNAVVHTPPGSRIMVTARRFDGRVRLAVRDDGEGIDPQALGRIFEPFYTADDAQGSGLGLAIASELAECMAGRLSVDSRPGETTFTLELPA
ncbi:MAG: HAMP domain-containing histidine kinase [Solirubrobacterales bacterium]|nr:HAMP domain-containing histidine kinase [Solirubrobacterales bacterium]MBV8947270.1 HAMP domain-containing histidine kinase [Solirubrobacterales bacterium]MBV9367080.1 HAMP domain-containing histidine kinase [Solirubrobacterales bacterium]MBV9682099.1 HAMP domain-containing histidine kinase [Solirubrobacterales bacterium]